MIEGLAIKKVVGHQDHEGFFGELVKFGEETFHEIKQTSYSETRPGVIKAFHYHPYWEIWCVVKGRAKIVVADIREGSPTRGNTEVIETGEGDMKVIAIPPGVAHGYQVLGDSPMGIIYHAAEAYDQAHPRIEHLPQDSPLIGFDWSKG